ncbi:Transmembrane 9 superfamily member 1 [Podosphaera aphanis]|nr:Transmembrane 9 superfamily member 1 [Podosphaera aphanis]
MLRQGLAPSTILFTVIFATLDFTQAFYLPGVAPTSYQYDDKVPIHVNRLSPATSHIDGTLQSVVSFDYYHPAFHFCKPDPRPEYVSESLGSILFGDRIMTSAFELKMAHNETCKTLCTGVNYDSSSAHFVNRRIEQGFAMHWLVDGLPAGQLIEDEVTNTKFYSQGFALGSYSQKGVHLSNHYDILIDYHETSPGLYRVIGVIVQPDSRQTPKSDDGKAVQPQDQCGSGGERVTLDESGHTEVDFTYSVYWLPTSTAWATRWDKYLHVFDPKIHWFSLINSTIIVVFLVFTVISVLLRALKKDIARYNRLDSISLDDLSGTSAFDDGIQEDSGWKLIHGDVFRTPTSPLILSIFVGNGAQLFVMTGCTIAFALLGFLSPSNRGSLGTIMVLLYTVFGIIGGYVSAKVYKSLGGERWKLNIGLTPLLVPGIVFSTFFLLNLFLWSKQSSGAVPFTTMLVLVGIWFTISVPLSFAGSWIAFRQAPIASPVHTNQIPRQIPPSSTYLKPVPCMLLVGILPFGAIFVELYFIMSSIWFSKVYYMFGFLFICYGLMVTTCAAVTVLMVYFLLCSENYHWHWRSFTAAGASAGYVFANAMIYWFTKFKLVGLAGSVLYIGYSALISFLFFILTGTIGFFASWAFVQTIYGSIKVD